MGGKGPKVCNFVLHTMPCPTTPPLPPLSYPYANAQNATFSCLGYYYRLSLLNGHGIVTTATVTIIVAFVLAIILAFILQGEIKDARILHSESLQLSEFTCMYFVSCRRLEKEKEKGIKCKKG